MSEKMMPLHSTLAGREYERFLVDYGFSLVLDEDGDRFSCTIFRGAEMLLAVTYMMNFGENFAVAPIDSPIDAGSVEQRTHGWSLIGEVWDQVYSEFHAEVSGSGSENGMDRDSELQLMDRALRLFVSKVRSGEVSIINPSYRMQD